MNLSATLVEIAALSLDERLRLVEAIWETIDEEQLNPDLTEVQKDILDRRINELDASPDNVLTWEEIKAYVRGER